MSHDPLDELLSALPRVAARPDFTARVLERVETPVRARRLGLGLRLAAAVALLAATFGVAHVLHERTEDREELARIERLRTEHAQLARELEAIRAAAEPPLLYIPGRDVDILFEPAGASGRGSVGLASNRTY